MYHTFDAMCMFALDTFILNEETGVVETRVKLNRLTKSNYEFRVQSRILAETKDSDSGKINKKLLCYFNCKNKVLIEMSSGDVVDEYLR